MAPFGRSNFFKYLDNARLPLEMWTRHRHIRLFRGRISLRYIPGLKWRAKVIFIPKVSKKGFTHPKSFGPIFVSARLLRRCWTTFANLTLNYSQYSYRAGHLSWLGLVDSGGMSILLNWKRLSSKEGDGLGNILKLDSIQPLLIYWEFYGSWE